MRVDLHVHTRESAGPPEYWLADLLGVHECYSQPEDVVAEAARKGLDAVAITNHDAASHALRMAREKPDRVIPGCEYKVYGGTGRYVDVVVLGIDEKKHSLLMRARHRGVKRFTAAAKAEGLITILAHPAWEVNPEKRGIDPASLCQWLEHFDIIETLNSNCPAESEVSAGLARYFDKTQTGGSDAHDVPAVGTAWTEADTRNIPEFLEALRAGEVRPGGNVTDPARFAATSREVLGAFYRRELLKIVRKGSLRGLVAKSGLTEILSLLTQVLILPGLLWVPQVKSRSYLGTLSARADKLRTRLLDYLMLDLARDLAVEDMPHEERRKVWVETTSKMMASFPAIRHR